MAKAEEVKHRGVYEKVSGSGVWWIRYFDADGQKHREKVGRKSDAIKLYGVRKAEILAGAKLPQNLRHKGDSLADVIDRAIRWYEEHRPKSVRTARIHLEQAKDDLGSKTAIDLKPEDVDGWITGHTEWSPGTKNRYKATLGRALQLEVIAGRLPRNVARLVTSRKEENSRVRWMTDEEEARLVEAINKSCPEYLQSFVIAHHTGMRQGEQYSLTWDEIDLDRKKIFLDKTKNGHDREVPMSKACLEAFQELKARRKKEEWVFMSARYPDRRLQNPRQWFDDIVKAAKVKNFHWHDLRHTFCSRLVMKGVDLLTVSKLAGHTTIAVTQRYAHLSPSHLAGAVDVLDR